MVRTWSGAVVAIRLAVAALCLCGTVGAQAQTPDEQMLQLSNEGVALFNAGRYEEAIQRFEQAYGLVPDPNLLFNIARSHEKLGRTNDAITFYERFKTVPGIRDGDRERADRRLEALRAQLRTPVPPAGTVPPTDPPKKRKRVAEWVLIGAGIAGAVAAGVCGGLALDAQSRFTDETRIERKEDLRTEMRSLALGADVSAGIGAAALITGIVLYFTLPDPAPAREGQVSVSTTVSPVVLQGGGGAALGVRF